MRIFTTGLILLLASHCFSQKSEDLVPQQAVSVFSINNVNLLQKISLDDLVKYEFMEEVQQELFDGSTSGKTLKDSGIDFDQKVNVFFGRTADFELSGFTFGVKDRSQLFEVFDDFLPTESDYEGVDFYVSYFNRIAIQGNSGILFRVTPSMNLVNTITDSIWYARGNDYPWTWEESFDELLLDMEENGEFDEDEESEDGDVDVEFFEEMETEENTSSPIENSELPVADEDPTSKTYYELRDSVEFALQAEHLNSVCEDLFVNGDNLIKFSSEFKNQVARPSEGTFYFDNSRTLRKNSDFIYLRRLYPSFYKKLEELYYGNVMLGDLIINDNSIELELNAHYGDKLGSIYKEMTNAKFDKNALKYVPKDNSSFFTFRLNMREAYEQMYEVMHPLLESEADKSRSFSSSLLFLELWDDFVNKDAIFGTYQGNMFGAYNGIQKVKTKKFVFEYDEETFEYTEQEVEAEEDMPLFTLGFSTERSDIPEKILRHIERTNSYCRRQGDYWVFNKAILNSAPLFVLSKNGLLIFTNDEDLVMNHSDGYGSDALSKAHVKKAKKSGFLYAYTDLGKAIENVPRELFNDEENELIDVVRGKSGKIEFTSSETSSAKTSFNLAYDFEGDTDASTYILDLINSLYVISK
jgi:hypothetical protein